MIDNTAKTGEGIERIETGRSILGARIRQRRRELGITHADLARRIGISASYLNLIEWNKRQIAGPLLRKTADALDLELDELDDVAERRLLDALSRYMVIKIGTSATTALFVWVWLWLFGIDFAILWAILAFLFNFIPYVGAVLMAIPAVLMALVQADLQTALLVALGYLFANTLIGTILEPRIMGKGLGLSTLAVFLSLLVWAWVLGTIGAFLAVPLTIALMIAFEASPATRPLAILLGPDPDAAPLSTSAPAPSPASTGQDEERRRG